MADEHIHPNETQRIEAFSDGVFAIAITLLIIEIGVPHVTGDESLSEALGDLWPSYLAYVLSFVMIGIYWANHHSLFRLFVRTDHYFLMLNVFFLMTIAFLPFPTAVLGEYLDDAEQRDTAVTLYALGLLLPAFGWFIVWLYANVRGLVDERLGAGVRSLPDRAVRAVKRPLRQRAGHLIRQPLGGACHRGRAHAALPAAAAAAAIPLVSAG